MTTAASLLPEFDHEMATTRKVLAGVPAAGPEWRPHPKSTALGELASHLATIALWGKMTLERTELDLGVPENAKLARTPFTTTAELLERFDSYVRDTRAALAAASDADMGVTWTLKNGGKTIFSMPRTAVFRSFVMNHSIHHRAQLGVYLRLRDVPLPSTYGPSADTPR
jgi:uncharacterized damage-inducible protein DinB